MSTVKKPLVLKRRKVNLAQGNNNFLNVHQVKHNGKDYIVCEVKYLNSVFPFIVDAEDYQKIVNIKLHKSCNYVGRDVVTPKGIVKQYLHNIIMDRDSHDGKGQKTTVDHLNRIGTDNRKCNLEIKSQSDQNHNQCKRKRIVKLPEGCGIDPDEIPQHICYAKPCGGQGEYFAIDIKHQGKRVIRKKSTKSKSKTLREKLNHAKLILKQIMTDHPEYFESKCLNGVLTGKALENHKSYFEILKLAGVTDPLHHEEVNVHSSIMDT